MYFIYALGFFLFLFSFFVFSSIKIFFCCFNICELGFFYVVLFVRKI